MKPFFVKLINTRFRIKKIKKYINRIIIVPSLIYNPENNKIIYWKSSKFLTPLGIKKIIKLLIANLVNFWLQSKKDKLIYCKTHKIQVPLRIQIPINIIIIIALLS